MIRLFSLKALLIFKLSVRLLQFRLNVVDGIFKIFNCTFLIVDDPVGEIKPAYLLLGTTLFLQNLLSKFQGQQSVLYYYAATMTAFIFYAALNSLGQWKKHERLVAMIIISLFIFSACYIPEWNKRAFLNNTPMSNARHAILSKIDAAAPVAASVNLLPCLATRKELFVAGRTYNTFTHLTERLADNVMFAVIDFSMPLGNTHAIKELVLNKDWSVDTAVEDMVLLKRILGGAHPLIETLPSSRGHSSAPINILSNPVITLETLDIPELLPHGTTLLPITYGWDIHEDLPEEGRVSVSLFKGNQQILGKARLIAYGLPLKKGERIKETYNTLVPPLSPGTYTVSIDMIVNSLGNKYYWSGPVKRMVLVR
ncbi:MAG: DUF2079 domain-containing protein [Candidatus Omnitrophica bacterium]|nr:DUF2079 domain-containing protein [Candidatus Omnitrophota bacterium]